MRDGLRVPIAAAIIYRWRVGILRCTTCAVSQAPRELWTFRQHAEPRVAQPSNADNAAEP